MMKRKFSNLAVILCVALAFSGMTGCGKSPESAAPEQAAEAAEEPEEMAEPAAAEEQAGEADEETEEAAINMLAIKGPSFTGLSNLTMENNENGTYIYEDMTEDGLTVIKNMCADNSQSDGESPEAYAETFVSTVVDETGSANVTETKSDEGVSAALTYPAYRVSWESGANEDTRQHLGVVVLTDNFTFYYGFGCPIDYYEENSSLYESELDGISFIDLSEAGGESAETAESGDEDEGKYADIYMDKMSELQSEGLADQFIFVNIDEDEIPELIASDSAGSFDHENAFIFTVYNDEVVQLAAVTAGVDGGSLDYAEGKNLIHISGAAAGMRDVFSKISDGKLEEVFTAEATSMDEDAEYSVNGSTVKENEYYEEINKFAGDYAPFTRIAYDGLYEVNYKLEDGTGSFEQGESKEYSL